MDVKELEGRGALLALLKTLDIVVRREDRWMDRKWERIQIVTGWQRKKGPK